MGSYVEVGGGAIMKNAFTGKGRGIAMLLLAGCMACVSMSAADPEPVPEVPVENEVGEPEREKETLWSLILKGGPVMIPLGLCSLIAMTSLFERSVSLRRDRIIPNDFIAGLKARFKPGNSDVSQGIAYCDESKSPVGRIFKAGLLNLRRGEAFVEKSIEDAGGREVDKLKRSLRLLGTIATVSPLLGMLGTVYGMIGAFETSAHADTGKAEMLAVGIYEALVTTATGLTIAIPVLICYYYLNSKIDSVVDDIDDLGIDFMEHYLVEQSAEEETAESVA